MFLDQRVMDRRILDVQRRMREAGVDALVITPSPDLKYLTGYPGDVSERFLAAVLTLSGRFVFILPSFELGRFRSLEATFELMAWTETEDPLALVRRLLGSAAVVGVNGGQPARFALAINEALAASHVVPSDSILLGARSVKDDLEIGALRKAHEFADAVFADICSFGVLGLTEIEIGNRMATTFRELGADRVGFVTVASGENSASPHHTNSQRRVTRGDVVLFDFGCFFGGYASDVSRTVAVGHATPRFTEVHAAVLAAQTEAIRSVTIGEPVGSVDRAARECLERAGFGDRFPHRVGHGIGLEVHEHPYLTPNGQSRIAPGMVFSIEPGVYLPGEFGVRIEDTVLVTAGGVDLLSAAPRGPLVIE